MPAGANVKREREFEHLRDKFRQSGRYKGREDEVAARIVNKQRSAYGDTRQEREQERKGRSPDHGLPIPGYRHLTIPQVKQALDALSVRDLNKIKTYEIRHKNRKGLLEILERRLRQAG